METRQTYIARVELRKELSHWRRVASRAADVEDLEGRLEKEVSRQCRDMLPGPCRSLLEDALEGVDWRKLARELWEETKD